MTLQITKAYDRVKAIDWNPSYIETDEKYLEQSRFFVKDLKPVDPFKTFIREYFKMEQEKENRHYSVLEASSRLHQGQAEARWMEGMKFGLSNFAFVEYSAGRQMGRMARSVAPVELRQGYMMQMIDEMRHAQLELNNLRHNMRTWHDPAGYDIALKGAGNNVGSGMFRAMMEDCTTCDPIETAISLQVFLETAYSNVFFVGLSSAAVAQGDHTMASTFLTIQSDEARHMANGWATLVTVLQDDRNVPLVQEVLDKWSWRAHVSFGLGNALFQDYFTKKRTESAKEASLRWVYDEFYGGFYQKLERYGIRPPPRLDEQMAELDDLSHAAAVYIFGAWPFFYHRADPMTAEDMEWFEKKYPGWYSRYGWFWEAYNKCKDPDDKQIILAQLGGLPNFCEVCQRPLIFPTPATHSGRSFMHGGKAHIACSPGCQAIYINDPQHYQTDRGFYDLYHDKELSEVVDHMGYVRDDGETLIGQPELNGKRMWRREDLRRCDFVVKRPEPPPFVDGSLIVTATGGRH
ncbi:hypothetical protein [Sinimarinibacterium flocculans]|uniref:hypothetical protein n=1 Tax=Sinimarinibacterium flocculans TaxID=985250 RepID=UPI0024912BDE|nr:hypothetical protein [Sinimarinibacterium flocculans]